MPATIDDGALPAVLKNLFKSGLQHADPEVRCRAVAALTPAPRDVLAEIARTDAVPAVRATALGRSDDLKLLRERASADADGTVRAQAAERYRALLAGHVEGAPALAERLQHLSTDAPTELLEYLARQGKEPGLREQALAGVHSVALLGELVLADAVAAVRHAALERLEDEATLEQIQQASRQNDKHVRRRTKEKLAALRAARERPLAVATRCEEICAVIDTLGEDDAFAGAEQRLQQLDREWQALEPEHRQPHEGAFAAARQRFDDRLAAHRRRTAQGRSAREAVIDGLQAALHEAETAPAASRPALAAALREASSLWQQGPALPAGEADDLQARFDTLCQAVRSGDRAAHREAMLATLCETGEALLARSGPLGEHEVKEWEHGLPPPGPENPAPADQALEQRVATLHARLRDRLREQVARKEEMLTRLPTLLEALATAVNDGTAKLALPLDDQIGSLLADLATIGVSRERIGSLAARHRALVAKVRVMRSWQRFGADQVRERLCGEVEALLGAERDPPEMARLLRAARSEWQALSAGDPAREHAFRRRFEKAASKVNKTCKVYFDEQARVREANRQKRLEVLARLETSVAETDWSNVDWKAMARLRRDAATDFKRAGPVDRKQAKGLEQRLGVAIGALDEHLEPERQRCLRERERLIERATALQQATDPRRAVDECKRLQREWVVTVPGRRGAEAALWDRFRAACDGVFGSRQRALDEQRDAWRENLVRKQALCERAEALASADAIDDAAPELARLQAEWREVGPVAKSDVAAVERRFAAAAERLAERRRADAKQARRDDLRRLQDKAELCHAAETLAAAGDADALATLETRWASLAALTDTADEQAITARFEQACQAVRGDAQAVARRAESEAENLRTRETLCLRMEILAAVESPPEHAAARMTYQVERLSSALAGRGSSPVADTRDGLLREWCLSGPAPAAKASDLETRFARACGSDGGPRS